MSRQMIDLTGQRFNQLVVIERVKRNNNRVEWLCKCDCGSVTIVQSSNLKSGHIKSCGCLIGTVNTKHGKWNTRLYNIYHAMKQRCYNEKAKVFKHYGEKGISICEEWNGDNGFSNFYNWSIENGYSDNLSIDRINPSGNYSPDNCRWTTKTIQSFNRKKGDDNSTGYVGVSKRKDTGKYQSYISKNGVTKKLGCYDTIEQAVEVRKKAEKELYN